MASARVPGARSSDARGANRCQMPTPFNFDTRKASAHARACLPTISTCLALLQHFLPSDLHAPELSRVVTIVRIQRASDAASASSAPHTHIQCSDEDAKRRTWHKPLPFKSFFCEDDKRQAQHFRKVKYRFRGRRSTFARSSTNFVAGTFARPSTDFVAPSHEQAAPQGLLQGLRGSRWSETQRLPV